MKLSLIYLAHPLMQCAGARTQLSQFRKLRSTFWYVCLKVLFFIFVFANLILYANLNLEVNLFAIHGKRVTIKKEDLELAVRMANFGGDKFTGSHKSSRIDVSYVGAGYN